MTWFKVDDSFHSHPKVLAAEPAALGLWVVAGAWSSANLTEGFVPDRALQRLLPDGATLAKELVAAGLWTRSRGGYQFHDWTDYQPTKDEAIAVRERKSSGGRIGNHRRWHEARGVSDPECIFCQQKPPSDYRSDIRSHSDQSTESLPNRPSRPVQSPKGTRTDTGSRPSSPRNARARPEDDDSIDLVIIQLLTELAGIDVGAIWATQVRQRILDGHQIRTSRLAYVTASIRNDPAKWLPPGQQPPDVTRLHLVPDRPAWCHTCDERTRLLDVPGAPVARCPVCHPLAHQRETS